MTCGYSVDLGASCYATPGCLGYVCETNAFATAFSTIVKWEPCQEPLQSLVSVVTQSGNKTFKVQGTSFFNLEVPVTVPGIGPASYYAIVDQANVAGKRYTFDMGIKVSQQPRRIL